MSTGTTTVRTLCERSYRHYAPSGIGSNRPLLIVLHPGLSNANAFQNNAANLNGAYDLVADTLDMHVVYPDGTARTGTTNTWNAGDNADLYASHVRKKDVLFIKNLITVMSNDHSIDTGEVYLMGYSNGAMLTYRYLMEYPGDIAGVLVFAGSCLKDFDESVASITVPIIHVHGTADPTVPPAGGQGNAGTYHSYPTLDAVEAFFTGKGATFTRYDVTDGVHTWNALVNGLVGNLELYFQKNHVSLLEEMIGGTEIVVLDSFLNLDGDGLPSNPAPYSLEGWAYTGIASGGQTSGFWEYNTGGVTSYNLVFTGDDGDGVAVSGVDLSAYSKIRIDAAVVAGGTAKITIADGDTITVSDTLASGTGTLECDLSSFTDPTDCTITIGAGATASHDLHFDSLRGVV